MSTVIIGEITTNAANYDSRIFSVRSSKPIEDLSEYVRRIRAAKDLSTTDVENNSGRKISDAYVTQIENRRVKNVSPEKLKALAKGLGITEDEIFAVARGQAPEDSEKFKDSRFALLSLKFDKIPPDQRVNVEALIELLDRELDRLGKN